MYPTEDQQPIENKEVESSIITQEEYLKQPCKHSKCAVWRIIFYSFLMIAIGVLYFFHFSKPKQEIFTPKEFTGTPGTGEVLFMNLDTINAHYELVKILQDDIKAEMSKQEAIFANKENAFKKKYATFQENYSQGGLSQVQIENASRQLELEYQQLEANKERVFSDLQDRQATALMQIYDSIQAASYRVNAMKNASFVITYQTGSPFVLLTDPSKEITDEVLFELNKPYKKR